MERAKERLDDLKEMNWNWGNYSNSERSGIRAEARELQRAINSGHLSYQEAYGGRKYELFQIAHQLFKLT